MSSEIEDRLRNIIVNVCNKIGCKNCDIKWEGGCQAVILNNELVEQQVAKEKQNQPADGGEG